MSATAWILLITLSILWGGSFFFAEIALKQLGPLTIVAARVAIGAGCLIVFLCFAGLRLPRDGRTWRQYFIMGGLNNALPFALIVWGQVHLTSGVASILNATTPLFTVLVAHAFTADERITANKLTGVLVGIVGVAILMGSEALSSLGGAELPAQFAILGAAISYAFASVYGRRLRGQPTSVAATGMLCCSTVLLLPLAFVFESPLAVVPNSEVILSLLGLGLLSSSLAYLIYFRILELAGATNLMLVTLLVPISALVLGVLILHESIPLSAYIGMLVIFGGLACIDGRLIRMLKR
ncbi:MAG: DMT family transporter [Pseudomonadota bacterium]